MSEKDYDKMSDSEKKKEDWMNSKWRPMMGWSYMATCITDFIIFPALWSVLQSISQGQVNVQWQPITLQGAGLYHIAMGAILGIAAYGRTQEKLNGANNGGISLPTNVGTTYTPPAPVPQSPVNNTPTVSQQPAWSNPAPAMAGGASSASPFGNSQPATVVTAGKGKPGPFQPDQPEI